MKPQRCRSQRATGVVTKGGKVARLHLAQRKEALSGGQTSSLSPLSDDWRFGRFLFSFSSFSKFFFSELFIWETMWWDPPAQSRRPVFAEVRDESP